LVPREFAERLLATRGQVGKERRVVTMLFSDVKGSTTIAEDLDPEEFTEIMEGAFGVLIGPITRYEGTLVRMMGDAILACFGAPIAHEDDAERACRAALDIIEGAKAYAVRLEEERGIAGFNVRVGIHTGLVVVGEVGSDLRMEYTAMGDAVNLASRMETAAEPGTVLITEDTHRLIASMFETEDLGPMQVKGRARLVSAYRLLAPKAVVGKGRGIAGLESPLVGREAEFHALQKAVERLQAGLGGLVTIVGEAGIGKSRLVAEVRREHSADILSDRLYWVEGRCLSYGASTAYPLWLDALRSALGLSPEDPPLVMRSALQALLEGLCPELSDDVYPYLALAMSLPLEAEDEAMVRGLEGEGLRAATFRAVETFIEATASDAPLVLVFEDLHWADHTSIQLLEHLLGLMDRAPLLIISVFRPRTEHGCWRIRETAERLYRHRHTDLWLDPLSAAESTALMANLLRVEGLPRQLEKRVLSHAEGNPFYVEEIIRSLIDGEAIVYDDASGRWQAVQEVEDIAIPDTLQGVLMARIDHLQEEARRVLQLASVIGRIFLHRVLASIADEEQACPERTHPEPSRRSRRALDQHLLALQREEMIRERARVPELEYIFKHHLTQVAAYSGILRRERRRFHHQVAEALERLFPDRTGELVDLLAYHWEQADEPQKAVGYLLQAGDRDVRLSAYSEAIAHFTRGLALLEMLPDTPERAGQELRLQIARGAALQATKGWGASDVVEAFGRARELCEQLGDAPQLDRIRFGLFAFYLVREELHTAHELAEQLLRVARTRSSEDPFSLCVAHGAMGLSLCTMGGVVAGRDHLEQAIALYDPERHRSLASTYLADRKVMCLSWQAFSLWLLGYPRQALASVHAALAWAQEMNHPYSVGFARWLATWLHQWRGEAQLAREQAEELIAPSNEQGFPFLVAGGAFMRGAALIMQGRAEEGLTQMRQSLIPWRATGSGVGAFHLALLADGHRAVGQIEEALEALREGLDVVQRTGERFYEAEVYRLQGELLLLQGAGEPEVEGYYRQALEISRRQQARSLELRAAMSLCRLWQRQGKVREARQVLSEIYDWFTEGFGTADLREAKALLEALSGG